MEDLLKLSFDGMAVSHILKHVSPCAVVISLHIRYDRGAVHFDILYAMAVSGGYGEGFILSAGHWDTVGWGDGSAFCCAGFYGERLFDKIG